MTGRRPADAIKKLRRLQEEHDSAGRASLDLLIAQITFQLGRVDEATRIVDSADAVIGTLDPSSEDARRLRATERVARAMFVSMTEPEAATGWLLEAREYFDSVGDIWKIGAVDCNLAIAKCYEGDPKAALVWLDSAEEATKLGAPDPRTRDARLRNIEVNRSAARGMLLSAEEELALALKARALAIAEGDLANVGRIELNLTASYLRLNQFSSAVRAAESARDAFLTAGLASEAVSAKIQVAKANLRLGRPDGVREYLVGLLDEVGSGAATRPAWWDDANDTLAEYERARDPAAALTSTTDISPSIRRTPVLDAIAQLMSMMDGIYTAILSGDALPPIKELRKHVDRIRSVAMPIATTVGDVLEAAILAMHGRGELRALTDEEEEALRLIGLSGDAARDLVRAAQLMRTYNPATHFLMSLGEVADHQVVLAGQESELDRSELHDRIAASLSAALGLSEILDEPGATFELLEAGRRDLSEWADLDSLPLPPFTARAHPSLGHPTGAERRDEAAMSVPQLMSVLGRSALHEARRSRNRGVDAEDIRVGLGGPDAGWLTMRVIGADLVWAWLADGVVKAGRRQLDESFDLAWRTHDLALPTPTSVHASLFEDPVATWELELVAAAFAAYGPLVQRAELGTACLDALPRAIRERTLQVIERIVHLPSPYLRIADAVLPGAVRDWLDRGGDRRLLLSVPPQFATLPTVALDLGADGWLGERAVVGFAPPGGLAARILARAPSAATVASVLTVADPLDDLASARERTAGNLDLVGLGRASSPERVATRSNLLRALGEAASEGRPYSLAYLGHIRAGTRGQPGRSALVLAPESVDADADFFDARDVARSGITAPRDVYLGGCESTGFGTGLEWASIAGAFLAAGADRVLAHAWPIFDTSDATRIDAELIRLLEAGRLDAKELLSLQQEWIAHWRRSPDVAVPPHHWAGLNVVGRFG